MSNIAPPARTGPFVLEKAVHSWSLFRTLGRHVAPGSMPSGDLPEGGEPGLDLLDLPAELAARGYRSVQLCHFYLPSIETGYLAELRAAFADADVTLECLLIDDGDLTHPTDGDRQQEWISTWIAVAAELQAGRVRVLAGKQSPTPGALRVSADRLTRLALRFPQLRIVTENWHALLPDSASVNRLLDQTENHVGFLIDLGNWTGPTKYQELAAVAGRAESCQAKVVTDHTGAVDATDYRESLTVLRDAGYNGPLALVYDGPDPDEWAKLDEAFTIVGSVFGDASNPARR
jgi:sugar phosphate isomerase/epimerase